MSASDYLNDTAARAREMQEACARHGSSAEAATLLSLCEAVHDLQGTLSVIHYDLKDIRAAMDGRKEQRA
jgi:hypothetical protein